MGLFSILYPSTVVAEKQKEKLHHRFIPPFNRTTVSPLSTNRTGKKSFCADRAGTIYWEHFFPEICDCNEIRRHIRHERASCDQFIIYPALCTERDINTVLLHQIEDDGIGACCHFINLPLNCLHSAKNGRYVRRPFLSRLFIFQFRQSLSPRNF